MATKKRKRTLYEDIYSAVKFAYPTKTGEEAQKKAIELWNNIKAGSQNDQERVANSQSEIKKLKELGTIRKASFTNFFIQVSFLLYYEKKNFGKNRVFSRESFTRITSKKSEFYSTMLEQPYIIYKYLDEILYTN